MDYHKLAKWLVEDEQYLYLINDGLDDKDIVALCCRRGGKSPEAMYEQMEMEVKQCLPNQNG